MCSPRIESLPSGRLIGVRPGLANSHGPVNCQKNNQAQRGDAVAGHHIRCRNVVKSQNGLSFGFALQFNQSECAGVG